MSRHLSQPQSGWLIVSTPKVDGCVLVTRGINFRSHFEETRFSRAERHEQPAWTFSGKYNAQCGQVPESTREEHARSPQRHDSAMVAKGRMHVPSNTVQRDGYLLQDTRTRDRRGVGSLRPGGEPVQGPDPTVGQYMALRWLLPIKLIGCP